MKPKLQNFANALNPWPTVATACAPVEAPFKPYATDITIGYVCDVYDGFTGTSSVIDVAVSPDGKNTLLDGYELTLEQLLLLRRLLVQATVQMQKQQGGAQ